MLIKRKSDSKIVEFGQISMGTLFRTTLNPENTYMRIGTIEMPSLPKNLAVDLYTGKAVTFPSEKEIVVLRQIGALEVE